MIVRLLFWFWIGFELVLNVFMYIFCKILQNPPETSPISETAILNFPKNVRKGTKKLFVVVLHVNRKKWENCGVFRRKWYKLLDISKNWANAMIQKL